MTGGGATVPSITSVAAGGPAISSSPRHGDVLVAQGNGSAIATGFNQIWIDDEGLPAKNRVK